MAVTRTTSGKGRDRRKTKSLPEKNREYRQENRKDIVAAKKSAPPLPTKQQGKVATSVERRQEAKAKLRKVTRRAVRKGISGPTEDSLGITKNEGSAGLRKAISRVGYDKAVKVASKTRMRQGQTYVGGKGWVDKKTTTRRSKKRS